jgi:DNA repair exonuclease SbcCD ATPase subunit
MKYVDFKSIEIKNFLSIGEEPVIINFNKGLNVITGINRDKEGRRNGVGKSTIVDAIFYSIFGETIRDLKKNHIVNNITNSTGYLKLCLTVDDPYYGVNEFVIVRTINPSKCYIYKNGIDKTLDSISNNNEYIQRLISASPDIFKSCVFMSLNNHIPFMAKTKFRGFYKNAYPSKE